VKKILITGITGQDGSFLAKKLIEKGYEVYGAVRRNSTPMYGRLSHLGILEKIKKNLIPIEVTEFSNVFRSLRDLRPDMIYNLAAQSFVQDSFIHPHLTSSVNYLGVLNFLESINLLGLETSFYQASTSEMFGDVMSDPQDENTPFNPMSPYAVSKCAAHQLVANYRKSYGIRASSGILFNHESELRGREFVTRKITYQMSEIANGRKDPIELGNLSSVRDWGYAPEYVDAMMLISNSNNPSDYVVATNSIFSVRDFFKTSAEVAGFKPIFEVMDLRNNV
jgi:GDPmannose 4,6-dehydratase